MEYIYIGKITSTHGLKGELKILSSFEKKDKVFILGNKLYIGDNKQEEEIITYRHHKNFDMVTLKNYNDINQVENLRNKSVYFNKKDLKLEANEYLNSDIINFKVYVEEQEIGYLKDILYNKFDHELLAVYTNNKYIYIPKEKDFIKNIDLEKKIIVLNDIKGMIE